MVDDGISQNVNMQVEFSLKLGQNVDLGLFKEEKEEFEKVFSGMGLAPKGNKSVRLFGVKLN